MHPRHLQVGGDVEVEGLHGAATVIDLNILVHQTDCMLEGEFQGHCMDFPKDCFVDEEN